MELEKGTVFEFCHDKFLVIDFCKHVITKIEYVIYKKLDSDVVMCLEREFFSSEKIWGEVWC